MSKLQIIGELIPDYALWISRLPAAVRANYLDDGEQLLADFTDTELRDAAREVARRESLPRMSQLIYVVERLVKQRRSQLAAARINAAAGTRTVKCRDCDDEGVIIVINPETVRKIRNGENGPHYTCVVRCPCEAGRRWRDLPVFSPSQHIREPIDGDFEKAVREHDA